jgi:TetR/AcrR family transcriptional regulator, fatty acid metabolism regulator protein
MRTRPEGGTATFTQRKRRDQLVDCMIDAIVQAGYPRASVAEVARRAGVSKGVVTYHFPAKDDLIQAVIGDVIAEMAQYVEPRLRAADPVARPQRFIAAYIATWTGYIAAHGRQVLALVRIYNAFRDETGRPNPAFDVRAQEVAAVTEVLRLGQATGRLGRFDPAVMAAVMKAALDDLLTQYADDPGLDLDAYGAELTAMFQAATRPVGPAPAAGPAPVSEQATLSHPADLVIPEEEQ